jgi:hypothetical protein
VVFLRSFISVVNSADGAQRRRYWPIVCAAPHLSAQTLPWNLAVGGLIYLVARRSLSARQPRQVSQHNATRFVLQWQSE